MNIWIISGRSGIADWITTGLRDMYPEAEVKPIERAYHFDDAVANGQKPDLILTDGTCKDHNEYGQSDGVYFSKPEFWASKQKIPCRYRRELRLNLATRLWLSFVVWKFGRAKR